MKKINLVVVLLLNLVCNSTFSQYENFNLSSYQFPDIKFKSLNTNFNLDGRNSNTFGTYRGGDLNLNTFANANYYSLISNSKLQSTTFGGINIGFANTANSQSPTIQDESSYSLSPNLFLNQEFRYYLNPNRFLEMDLNGFFIQSNSKSTIKFANDSTISETTNATNSQAFIPIYFGIGRIDPIEDARQAVLILREISKVDPQAAGKNDADILKLAKKITELKKTRILDSRLKFIYEMESLDSFLITNNYISNRSMGYFARLKDMWDFGSLQKRLNGSRFSVGVISGFQFDHFNNSVNNSTTNEIDKKSISFISQVKYEREKPINLNWQNSFIAKANFGIINNRVQEATDTSIRVPIFSTSFAQNFGYYPNTRTRIGFGYSLNYAHVFEYKDNSNEILGLQANDISGELNLSLSYYFSPQLQMNINGNFVVAGMKSNRSAAINYQNPGSSIFYPNGSIYPTFTSHGNNSNTISISLLYTLF